MKSFRGALLFTMILFYQLAGAQSVGLEHQPIDSALAWLDRNFADNPENFYEIALQILGRAYQTGENRTIAEAHSRLADWFAFHGFFEEDSTLFHSQKKLEYYLKDGDQTEIAACYRSLTIDYLNAGRYKEAQEAAFKAIGIYEKLNDQEGLGRTYRTLSSVFIFQEQPELAIEYGRKAIAILEKGEGDYYGITLAMVNLTQAYNLLNQYDRALQVADSCLLLVEEKVPEENGIKIRAYSFRADVFLKMKDYERALEEYTFAWKFAEGLVGPEQASSYRTEIGKTLQFMGRYREAIPHLEAGIRAYEERNFDRIWEPYEQITICYERVGDFEKALDYNKRYIKAYTKMMQGRMDNLASEAVIKYETGKKDQALVEQALQIRQQARIQLLSWSIAALLGILFLGLFFSFRRNKKTTAELKAKNDENELLLKEIHHRVKNNLQTISSLLSLQSESISDKSAFDAVQESKNRVTSMALLHQKLYQGENLAAIEMRDYFETIGKAIIDSFGEKAENVSLEISMPEIELDVDTAIPVGLITNELVTNSIKYAFPGKQGGQILITLTQEDNGLLKLQIADNGRGTAHETAIKKESGFGTLLVQLLTTQLGGKLEKSTGAGTSTVIQFPLQEKSVA